MRLNQTQLLRSSTVNKLINYHISSQIKIHVKIQLINITCFNFMNFDHYSCQVKPFTSHPHLHRGNQIPFEFITRRH